MFHYEKRPMTIDEEKYVFAQSPQILSQTGLIGLVYLYSNADEYEDWHDFHKDLKTNEFLLDYNALLNSLRAKGEIFHSSTSIYLYCRWNPQSYMETVSGYYGVRVDTEKYTYLLRFDPNVERFCCWCYVKEWLDAHINRASKGIRFIDSRYKELFRIPDGGKVRICLPGKEGQVKTCRYIDDYHFEVGSYLYHICEFAEWLENCGATCEPAENGKRGDNNMRTYAEVRNDFYDESDNYYRIDAWKTGDDNEEGKVVAFVNGTTAEPVFVNTIARNDPLVQEAIREVQDRIKEAQIGEPDAGVKGIFDAIDSALALSGYKVLDGDLDSIVVRNATDDADYEIIVQKIG